MTIGQYSVDCCHFRGCTQHVKDRVVHVGSMDYTKIRKHARRLRLRVRLSVFIMLKLEFSSCVRVEVTVLGCIEPCFGIGLS